MDAITRRTSLQWMASAAASGMAGAVWRPATAADDDAAASKSLREEAANALRRAVEFYHGQASSHGGYVYRYSADLTKREGEGKTDVDTVWVQPPGTPLVGEAYLAAYERTGEKYLLEAARAAGECLRQGQLASGGWTDRIEFSAQARRRFAYRVDPDRAKRAFNVSTFDDDKTQSAVRMLVRLDRALEFRDAAIHESVAAALDAILKAQFPNGAWAQGFETFPEPDKHPVKAAAFPEDWPREYPGGPYWWHYTFNDNAIADTIETLLYAARVYSEPRYRAAALKAGDFILLAQLPDPQPAWAQQYNFEMQPAWARKFEPPAVSGSESQGLLRVLLRLYLESGDSKYLTPIPKALEYLKKSQIAPGQLARFYELRTNRPLYFTRDYQLTYDDGDLPTHYSFKVSSKLESIERQYRDLLKLTPEKLASRRQKLGEEKSTARPDDASVRAVLGSLDSRGAWVVDGKLKYHGKADDTRRIIDSETFSQNLDILSRYLAP